MYQNAGLLAPMAVDAVLAVSDLDNYNVDLKDIKVFRRMHKHFEWLLSAFVSVRHPFC